MKNQIEITNYLIDIIFLQKEICLDFHNKTNPDLPDIKLLFDFADAKKMADFWLRAEMIVFTSSKSPKKHPAAD